MERHERPEDTPFGPRPTPEGEETPRAEPTPPRPEPTPPRPEPTPPRPEPTPGGGPGPAPVVKADLAKRFLAALIDAVLAGVVSLVPIVGGIAAAAYMLVRDGLDVDFMRNRSLGKVVMKLRPVHLDGSPVDLVGSAKRNWMFALGGIVSLLLYIPIVGWLLVVPVVLAAVALGVVEIVLVLTDPDGRRFGDRIAETHVIESAE